MEVAVGDYDTDAAVESGITCYCSYKLECLFVNYLTSANKTAFVYNLRIKFYSIVCNNHGVVTT